MLNHYKISDRFCLDTFYAILMFRDMGRKFLQKNDEISVVQHLPFTGDFLFIQIKELIRTHH